VRGPGAAKSRWTENDARIIDMLIDHGPSTYAELIVDEKRARGIRERVNRFVDAGTLVWNGDRLGFPSGMQRALGIYVGNASVRLAVVDVNGDCLGSRLVDRVRYRDESFEWLLRRLRVPLRQLLEEVETKAGPVAGGGPKLSGVAMVLPTLIDPCDETRRARLAATYPPRWANASLDSDFRSELRMIDPETPLIFDVDAAADLLAEVRYGDHGRDGNMLLVKCSGEISAAFLAGRAPLRGTGPGAAGLGHVLADVHGINGSYEDLAPLAESKTKCTCGRDAGHPRPHLNQVASALAIADRVGINAKDRDDFVAYRQGLRAGLLEIQRAEELGAPMSGAETERLQHAVIDAGTAIGRALDSAVATLSPQVVVLSGYLAMAGMPFRDAVNDEIQSRDIRASRHCPEVRLSSHHDRDDRSRLGAIGAAQLSLQQSVFPVLKQQLRDRAR